jgi:hypothetical protein
MRSWVWSSHLNNKIKAVSLYELYHNKRWVLVVVPCIYTPRGEEEEPRTSQECLLWEQELRIKTKVGTGHCGGGWKGGAAEQKDKKTNGITFQTPGNQLCSVNFVMVILVCRVQVTDQKEIGGLEEMSHGRGKGHHSPTKEGTTTRQHDMEPRIPSASSGSDQHFHRLPPLSSICSPIPWCN